MNLSTITTQRLDRLSNAKLYLGLKTGTYLEAEAALLKIGNKTGQIQLQLGTTYMAPTADTHAAPKKFVDDSITNAKSAVLSQISGGTRISVTPTTDGSLVTAQSISLGDAYSASWFGNKLNGTFASNGATAIDYAVFTGQSDSTKYGSYAATGDGSGAGSFISAIKVDKYGAVVGVDYKKIAASDIDNTQGTYDNYRYWNLNVGSTDYQIASGADSTKPFKLEFTGAGITPTVSQIAGATGYSVSFGLDLDSTYFELNSSNKLTHKHVESAVNGLAATATLLKGTVDAAGHIVSLSTVTASDLTGIIGAHSTTSDGYVAKKADGNTGTATTEGYFYTSEGKWAQIPFSGVKVTASSKTSDIPLALSDGDHDITTLVYNTGIKANPSTGTLTATKFAGNGSELTNLAADKISSGTLSSDRLPTLPLTKGGLGAALSTYGVLVRQADATTVTTVTRPDGASGMYVLTSEKLANNKENIEFKNLQTLVSDVLKEVDAMVYKGTIGKTGATYNSTDAEVNLDTLLGAYEAGYTYKIVDKMVLVDGTDNKYNVEPGDTLIALSDSNKGSSPRFNVVQANTDGAVTYKNGTTATAVNELVVFNNTTGTTVKGTGAKIETVEGKTGYRITGVTASEADHAASASNADTATKLATENLTIFGNSFDGSASIPTTASLTAEKVLPNSTSATIGEESNAFASLYATELHGTADKVAHKLYLPGYDTANEEDKANLVYDGSKDITINIAALGGVTGITVPTKSPVGDGYYISNLVATPQTDGSVTVTPTYTKAINGITYNLFNVGTVGTDGKITIAPYTTKTTGKFFTDSARSNRLSYAGDFAASKVYIDYTSGSNTYSLPTLSATPYTESSLGANEILIAKDAGTEDGVKVYSYEKSGVKIVKSNDTNATAFNSDAEVATTKTVASYVTTQVSNLDKKVIKTLSLQVGNGSTAKNENGDLIWESAAIFTANDVIQRIAVEVKGAATSTNKPGLQIRNGTTTIMSSDENDITEAGVYIDNYYYTCQASSSIKAVITSSEATGLTASTVDAVIHVDYYTNAA